MKSFMAALVVTVLFCAAVRAETTKSTAAQRTDVSVTIYNRNLGLVREVRTLSIPSGAVSLEFQDVAREIDAKSVRVEAIKGLGGFTVLEQNYEFDLMSPEKLMEKYVGRSVELMVKHPQTGAETTLDAELLSMNGGPVYRIDGKIHVGHPGRVVLPEIPANLIARPTLVWLVTGKGGKGEIETSYLTAGMGWRADYVALLGEKDDVMDVTAWVTLTNTSGEVHRVVERLPRAKGVYMAEAAVETEMAEEELFEYHLYTLPRRTTIKDNQTKQVEMLSADKVGVAKKYVLPAQSPRLGVTQTGEPVKEKVTVLLDFENAKGNNLGIPLPAGIFRFYKKDSEGNLQLVGEDRIDHTPKGEKVTLTLGKAFDITAERVVTDYEVISKGKVYEYAVTVTLRNAKNEDITVDVLEQVRADWQVLSASHEYEKESASQIRFRVPVGREGTSELTYRMRIREF
jgi:hypothetical protein